MVNAHRPYGLVAYVARDGVVYKDQVLQAAHTPPHELRFPPTPTEPPPPPPLTNEQLPDPAAGAGNGELELTAPADWSVGNGDADDLRGDAAAARAAVATAASAGGLSDPFSSVLILIPLRLGLQSLNEIYEDAVKARRVCAPPGRCHRP